MCEALLAKFALVWVQRCTGFLDLSWGCMERSIRQQVLPSWIFPMAAWRGASGNRYRLPESFLRLHGDKHMLLLVLAKDEDVIHIAKNTFLPHENLVHSLLLRGT